MILIILAGVLVIGCVLVGLFSREKKTSRMSWEEGMWMFNDEDIQNPEDSGNTLTRRR